MLNFTISLIFLVSLTACSTMQKTLHIGATSIEVNTTSEELALLEQAENLFNHGQFAEAKKTFIVYQVKYRDSIYFQSAKLGEGHCAEMLNNFQQANEIYSDIYQKTNSSQPQIAVLALYRKSFAFEKSGDDFKALTTLLDIKSQNNLVSQLPEEVSQIQIPGRMALLYSKLGQSEESEKFVQLTNRNLEALKSKIPRVKLAESYYLIGSLSTAQINEENYFNCLRGFQISSRYLIKSLDLDQEMWSEKSAQLVANQLQDLWNTIIKMKDSDPQVKMTRELLTAMGSVEMTRPLRDEPLSLSQKEVFSYVDTLSENARELLTSKAEITKLTEESKKNSELKNRKKLR